MNDVGVSHSGMWDLRRYELGAWTVFILLLGIVPLLARRNLPSASDVRVQAVTVDARNAAPEVIRAEPSWRLDLNAATESELELLPGIGAGRARAILRERNKRGVFHTIWELTEVPGVTKALVQRLEPLIRTGPPRR